MDDIEQNIESKDNLAKIFQLKSDEYDSINKKKLKATMQQNFDQDHSAA